jgi:hypothetical protein
MSFAHQHRLAAAVDALHERKRFVFPLLPLRQIPFDYIAYIVAGNGYAREMDMAMGVSRALRDCDHLMDALGPHTRRLPGAVAAGNGPRVLKLLDAGAPPSKEAMLVACQNNSLGILEELLRRGGQVRYHHLFAAIEAGHQRLLQPLCEALRAQMEEAEAAPAPPQRQYARVQIHEIDRKNEAGRTPLMLAAELGQQESVWALVDAGADVNAWCVDGHELERDGPIAVPVPRRLTVLDVVGLSSSRYKGQIATFLRRRGAKSAPRQFPLRYW